VPLDYDPKNPFVLCAGTLTPIYQGTPSLTCLYCGSSYKLEMTGTTCTICQVTKIGATGTGLVRHL
jgi:coatomer protein complex subunit alpha (xenin)